MASYVSITNSNTYCCDSRVAQQAYLFRAALSELKTEITLIHRNESASIHTSLNATRRELEALDNKMKAEIANMKHEYVSLAIAQVEMLKLLQDSNGYGRS